MQHQNLKSLLKSRLFNSSKYTNQGFFLNVQYLPFLLKHILTHFQEEEQRSLIVYEVQNLILEVAAKGVDGQKTVSLDQITDYITKKVKSQSMYWERYSNPWHNLQVVNKPELIQQEQKKQAEAIELYNTQINMISEQSQKRESRLFEVSRKRIVQQNYQLFNFPAQNKTYQKIDLILLPKLKEFAKLQYPQIDELMVEYFLLDCCLSNQQRRKRKRTQLYQQDKSEDYLKQFKEFLTKFEIKIDDYLMDEPKQNQMLQNIIKSLSALSKLKPIQTSNSSKIDISTIIEEPLSIQKLNAIVESWFSKYCSLIPAINQINSNVKESSQWLPGCTNSQQQIQKMSLTWHNMFNLQSISKANKYKFNLSEKIDWTQQQYRMFLQGLISFCHLSVNNKKIASFMGKNIQPNHVKFIKGQYLRNMRLRRGKQSKKQFMKNDLDNFSMKIFQKPKVVRTKKNKKSKKNDDDMDNDSSY